MVCREIRYGDINLNHNYGGSLSSDIKMNKTLEELDQTFREEDLSFGNISGISAIVDCDMT